MRAIVCLTLCVLAVLAADPPRPQIPRTFETKAAVQFQHPNGSVFLDGEGKTITKFKNFYLRIRSLDVRFARQQGGRIFLLPPRSLSRHIPSPTL